MKITGITFEHLEIPFNISFSHAAATRAKTDSVLVKVTTEQYVGYGESCPRPYVTNETYQTALMFFKKHKVSLMSSVSSLISLKAWIKSYQNEIDLNPAAWCAIELALLDVLAREEVTSVEKLLQLPNLSGSYQYTAVLGDCNLESFSEFVSRYQSMGFLDYKIKLSGDIEHDKAKCEIVVEKASDARIRLDANNLWQNPNEVVAYLSALKQPIFAIEEPLQANDYAGLSEVSNQIGIKIVLDESFLRIQQFDCLKKNPDKWVINVRISKMGGLLRSIDIVSKLSELDIDCVVGAQVGETSLLTRSALTLVNAYRDVVVAQEGACGTYLLEHDICNPLLVFTKGGKISSSQIQSLGKHGFGLTISKTNKVRI